MLYIFDSAQNSESIYVIKSKFLVRTHGHPLSPTLTHGNHGVPMDLPVKTALKNTQNCGFPAQMWLLGNLWPSPFGAARLCRSSGCWVMNYCTLFLLSVTAVHCAVVFFSFCTLTMTSSSRFWQHESPLLCNCKLLLLLFRAWLHHHQTLYSYSKINEIVVTIWPFIRENSM